MAATTRICPACGGPNAAAFRIGSPPPPGGIAHAPSPRRNALIGVVALASWPALIGLNLWVTYRVYGSWTPEAVGYLFGRCIVAPVLPVIAVLIYIKAKPNSLSGAARFLGISLGALGLSILAAGGTFSELAAQHSNITPERVSQLAREALGQVPITPDQSIWDSPIRSFFSDVKDFNVGYESDVAALDKSALKNLYAAPTFQDHETMTRIVSQLQAVRAVDAKYASLDPLLQKLRSRIWALNTSENAKETFWKGFETSARASVSTREAITKGETEWLDASAELYQFTLANENSYSIKNDKLLFRDGSLSQQFSEKMQKASSLRAAFLQQIAAYRKMQEQGLGKIGLRPNDFRPSTAGNTHK
jgi:hypothetical protein